MGKSRGVLGAASVPFIGCVSLLAAMILHILAFASPFWTAEDEVGDFGLWRVHRCIGVQEPSAVDDEACYKWNHHWDVSEWLNAVRGLECLTIIFWSIPLVVLPVYIYVALGLYYRCLLGTMTVFTFIGACCSIAGVIVFGIHIEDNSELSIRWCLPVCGVGAGLGFIAAIIFLIACLKRPEFAPDHHFVSGFYADPDRNRMYVVENVEPEPISRPGTVIVSPGQINPALVVD